RSCRAGGVRERLDLPERHGAHVGPIAQRLVPVDDALQRLVELDRRTPAEPALGPRGVELEVARLVRMRALVEHPAQLLWPQLGHPLDDPADRTRVLVGRAEVPACRVLRGLA